eukprot:gene324-956_t
MPMLEVKKSLMLFHPIFIKLCLILVALAPGQCILHGMRLGDFPKPDFTTTIKSLQSQRGSKSFKVVHFPRAIDTVPDLVKVSASTQDGDSAGFHFEGTGTCQNPGSKGYYGGLIFAYNYKQLRVWAPTKYHGNTNGKLIFVEDGWGGEKKTQSSRIADVTVEVWNKIVTPNFRTEIQVDATKNFYEVPHKLKQIPDFVSVRVYSRKTSLFDKKHLFHFHAAGVTQNSPGTKEYGGVIFAYNEAFIKLWLPNTGNNLATGCIKITNGWGSGKYSNEMNSQTCQIDIRAWINSFPAPAFQTEWKLINANAHMNSFKEIYHNLKVDALVVQVQVKKADKKTNQYIFEGVGSVQATQSIESEYGGLLFAYDKQRLRIWVPSSATNDKGRVIFVSGSWGNGTHVQDSVNAMYRIRIYAPMCPNATQILDGQRICRESAQTGLVWKTSNWGVCSSSCSQGIQKKKLIGCHVVVMETVFSCDFERNNCNFTSRKTWKRSRGFFEKKDKLSGFTQPPSGFQKGSFFIYSDIKRLPGGSMTQLTSQKFSPRKNCKLRFFYNTGVYFHYFEVHVLISGKFFTKWRMTDKQPGNPYVWFPGYVNLEYDRIEQFRFSLRLSSTCRDHCGYVAFDDITLQCEAEQNQLVPLQTCEQKAIPLPGCEIDVLQPLHKGPSYSEVVTKDYGVYVKANGSHMDQIATYHFNVQHDNYYSFWLNILSTGLQDNSVAYQVDNGRAIPGDLVVIPNEPTYNRLNAMGIFLQSGVHRLILLQYEKNFQFKNLIVAPNSLITWSSLGMQNVHINDMFLTSILASEEEQGALLRLNGQGAWITNEDNFNWAYWQIELPDLALIHKLAIQGHCHKGACCASDNFQLGFSFDGKYYAKYRNKSGDIHMFEGTSKVDPERVVMVTLPNAVPVRGIRIFLFHRYLSMTCVRVEFYGHYMTKGMCSHASFKPDFVRTCTGDGKCGPNAECQPIEGSKTTKHHAETCQCSLGFHGNHCQFAGCSPNPCQNGGSCQIVGQIFKCTCQPGFTGKLCQLRCPKDKYGPGCNQTCYCPGRSQCHAVTGKCSCERGYTGILCNEVCPKGLFGMNCSDMCECSSIAICDHVTGSCYCPFGYYGDNCDIPCPAGFYGVNCSLPCRCAKHSKCIKQNGTCACPDGWTGEFCFKPCADGKYGHACSKTCNCPVNAICSKVDGLCSCKKGWTGWSCNRKCQARYFGRDCLAQCKCNWLKTEYCDHVTGKCICKAGFSGSRCENACPSGTYGPDCKFTCKCQNSGYCIAATGACNCQDGYIGDYCENVCPTGKYGRNCSKTCRCVGNQTEYCHATNGKCDCLPGYKGKKCHKPCPRGHWGRNCELGCLCYNGARCDPIDGFCSCTAGWQGESCESACSNQFYGPGCKSACQCKNAAICNRMNGNCTCTPGYIGAICDEKCPNWNYGPGCSLRCDCVKDKSILCNNINGKCGCKAGYKGTKCEKECDDKTYGIGCRFTCPDCSYHVRGPCNKSTGACRCSLGYHGYLCVDPCPLELYGEMCRSACNCTSGEICSNIDGRCFERENYEFFVRFRQPTGVFVTAEMRRNLIMKLELLMATYYDAFTNQRQLKQKSSIGDYSSSIFANDVAGGRRYSDGIGSYVKMIQLHTNRTTISCRHLKHPSNADKFSVRVINIQEKFDADGSPIANIAMVALYDTQPQDQAMVEKFLRALPKDCLSLEPSKGNGSCKDCSMYSGQIYDKKPIPKATSTTNIWIIIGCSCGGFFLCVAITVLIVMHRRHQNLSSSIYKVKKNSRDIELRQCLSSGDAGHVLAFENPYYDVIAAMGLDDDIEEDYYNPLYTYDDVSLGYDGEQKQIFVTVYLWTALILVANQASEKLSEIDKRILVPCVYLICRADGRITLLVQQKDGFVFVKKWTELEEFMNATLKHPAANEVAARTKVLFVQPFKLGIKQMEEMERFNRSENGEERMTTA